MTANAARKRRSTSFASTRSARCRWMPCRRRTPATRGRRWRWRRWPTCSTRGSSSTTRAIPTGPTATGSCSPPGHASMLLYSTLYLAGYDVSSRGHRAVPPAGLKDPRPSRTQATRPGSRSRPGRSGRASATPSGWRSPSACSRRASTCAEHEVVDHRTFVIASDGDIQEGIASEASSLAGHLGLGRLIVFFDNNHIQLAGPTSDRVLRGRRRCATRPTAGTSRTSARTCRSSGSSRRPAPRSPRRSARR